MLNQYTCSNKGCGSWVFLKIGKPLFIFYPFIRLLTLVVTRTLLQPNAMNYSPYSVVQSIVWALL